MDYREKLCFRTELYNHEQSDALFLEAARSNVDCHILHCREYREIAKRQGFTVRCLETAADLWKIPCIPTLYYKSHRPMSAADSSLVVTATSSGTGGAVSRIGFDGRSLFFAAGAAARLIAYHGLFSPVPVHYLILGYQPHPGNETVITKTQNLYTLFAPALSREYAIKWLGGSYRPDIGGLLKALKRYERSGAPVRIVGFPAYLSILLKRLKKEGISCRLPGRSLILSGGGWKQFYGERVEKREMYRLAEEVLGIPESRFREFFGAAEHPGVYCDCKNHHFHIPSISRVIIRDVVSLKPLGFGQAGLVNLISPLVESMPLTSVVTDDLGILHPGDECGCGIQTPYLELLGRTGVPGIHTCAAGAAGLLKEVERRAFS